MLSGETLSESLRQGVESETDTDRVRETVTQRSESRDSEARRAWRGDARETLAWHGLTSQTGVPVSQSAATADTPGGGAAGAARAAARTPTPHTRLTFMLFVKYE